MKDRPFPYEQGSDAAIVNIGQPCQPIRGSNRRPFDPMPPDIKAKLMHAMYRGRPRGIIVVESKK